MKIIMNTSMSCIFLLILCFLDAAFMDSTAQKTSKRAEKYKHLNFFIEDLRSQGWEPEETQCLELLLRIMRNVQNSTAWATWIWDSMQNPTGHLYPSKFYNYGNYEVCLDFPWQKVHRDMKTQYCLAHIKLSEGDLQGDEMDLFGDANNYLRAKTKRHLKLNILNWGICTPVACGPQSVAKLVGVLFQHSHLGLAMDSDNITIDHCDTAQDENVKFSFDWGYYFTVTFLTFLIVFTIWATHLVDSCNLHWPYSDILKCFHIPRNVDYLAKITSNDMRSLFAIKVLCCILVTCLHVSWVMKTWTVGSASSGYEENDISVPLTLIIEIVLDTFLFMSSLLFMKGLIKQGSENFQPLKTVVKRYIRMTRNSFLIMLAIATLGQYLPGGKEIRQLFDSEVKMCRENWWKNVLMIHNYIDSEKTCLPVSWYIAVDFQLSVIATMMYWVYTRSKRYGIWLFLISLIVSIALPIVIVYSNSQRFRPLAIDIRTVENYRGVILKNEMYVSTHLRAVTYFIGMAMGYIIVTYNPFNHRNKIDKKCSILGFCLALAAFIGIFVVNNKILKSDYTPMNGALYLSLRRVVWTVLIGILVTICEYGQLPIVNKFLSWSAWVPFSKLTPGIYVVHIVITGFCSGTLRDPNRYDFLGVVINTLGVTVVAAITSFAMWMFYEAPIQNLTALFLSSGKKNVTSNTKKEFNGNDIMAVEKLSNEKKIR